MRRDRQYRGFSLTEVLLAVAILAVGMLFVGGTFALAIHFSTLSTERTIAAVVAEEAVAKIRLYGFQGDPNSVAQTLYESLTPSLPKEEFLYPSTRLDGAQRQYFWSALCRRIDTAPGSSLVQVTIFICRGMGAGDLPAPTKLDIDKPESADRMYEGSLLVDDASGAIYRVTRLDNGDVTLDPSWPGTGAKNVWVVPRPASGGRNPCITVYQTELVVPHSGTHAMGSGKKTLYAMEIAPQTRRVR
jgi:prepilin-type N-terminal cleavage/methylation domain-containing protein